MDVRLDDDAMKGIIMKAVLDSLTPERRETLIGEAVKQLLEKGRDTRTYADNRSNLQKAFDEAVYTVTAQVAREELSKEETLKTKVRTLMLDAWEKLTTGDAYEKLVQAVADGMRKAIGGDRY
jgi:hypothetical protein